MACKTCNTLGSSKPYLDTQHTRLVRPATHWGRLSHTLILHTRLVLALQHTRSCTLILSILACTCNTLGSSKPYLDTQHTRLVLPATHWGRLSHTLILVLPAYSSCQHTRLVLSATHWGRLSHTWILSILVL